MENIFPGPHSLKIDKNHGTGIPASRQSTVLPPVVLRLLSEQQLAVPFISHLPDKSEILNFDHCNVSCTKTGQFTLEEKSMRDNIMKNSGL